MRGAQLRRVSALLLFLLGCIIRGALCTAAKSIVRKKQGLLRSGCQGMEKGFSFHSVTVRSKHSPSSVLCCSLRRRYWHTLGGGVGGDTETAVARPNFRRAM